MLFSAIEQQIYHRHVGYEIPIHLRIRRMYVILELHIYSSMVKLVNIQIALAFSRAVIRACVKMPAYINKPFCFPSGDTKARCHLKMMIDVKDPAYFRYQKHVQVD